MFLPASPDKTKRSLSQQALNGFSHDSAMKSWFCFSLRLRLCAMQGFGFAFMF
jgi:hypothetical protein